MPNLKVVILTANLSFESMYAIHHCSAASSCAEGTWEQAGDRSSESPPEFTNEGKKNILSS